MAPPRLFISSTYYDLRFIRSDLAILEQQLGVEVVRFESGAIPYHAANTLPEACCKEIDNCHILVSIIGGRYGSVIDQPTESGGSPTESEVATREVSISRLEVERAVHSGVLLFAFVDADVLAQYRTYLANKDSADQIVWPSVDDVRVFEFIEYIHDLPGRNPVFPFRTPREVQDTLRDQLAGFFCDLLQREKLDKFASHLDQLIESAERMQALQQSLASREAEATRRMQEMVLPDHSVYGEIQDALGLEYRVFFRTREELVALLAAHGFLEVDPKELRQEIRRERLYFRRDSPRAFLGIPRSCFSPDSEEIAVLPSDSELVWSGPTIT